MSGGLVWAEIFAEAGLPAGVLNVVTHAPGEAGPIGDAFVEHPAVRRINFTGSTDKGRKLAEAAGRNLKRIVLELGGYNPLIVLADADLEYAVNASAFGAFLHQGQICMSARKLIVERSIADEFTERLAAKTKTLKAGDPKEHDTIIGPLINEDALATVKSRVDDAVAKGARVLAGGEAVGPCYQATLVADVPEDSELARLETFGPVAGDRGRRQRRRRRRARERDGVRAQRRHPHERCRPRLLARAADRRGDRPRQRPAGRRRAADAVRRREGLRLGTLRRAGGDRRVHRASLDHDHQRVASLPVLITSLREAVAELVRDGDTVALEGFTHLIPHAAGHELIRQGRRDLTLVRMTPDVVYDQLIGMGCARKLVFSWGGNPGVGSLHRFRDAVEHGWPQPLELEEHSHAGMAAAYAAGAANLPFAVLRGYRGGDLPAHTRVAPIDVPVHRRGARRRAGAAAGRRDRPRAAGRPARQRPALGDPRRAEGGRPRVGALDRDGRGDRRRARAAAGRACACRAGSSARSRSRPAARTRRTRTATTSATTTSTSRGTRSAATATASARGCSGTCSSTRRRRASTARSLDGRGPAA